MSQLFISDLHLDAARPDISKRFLDLIQRQCRGVERLYILGDLFEAWLGDDAAEDALSGQVAEGLSSLAESGTSLYFLHGNRDFLLGRHYAERCRMRLLPDPSVIDLFGTPTLLLHGDTLCTDDHAYQAFRRQVRDPAWQSGFLSRSLAERREFARRAREASRDHQAQLRSDITDVNPGEVETTFDRFGLTRMIHGHTHRPAVHRTSGKLGEQDRIVLGDWYEQGSALRVDAEGFTLDRF